MQLDLVNANLTSVEDASCERCGAARGFEYLHDGAERWKRHESEERASDIIGLTCVKCSGAPAPLLAITGMVTASLTAFTSSRSKPCGDETSHTQFRLVGVPQQGMAQQAGRAKSVLSFWCPTPLRLLTWPAPSLSMQFSRISPAPSASTACASSTAPMSRPSRPPLTVHCHHTYCSPLGPGRLVRTVWWATCRLRPQGGPGG